jgi:hypothetical protein
VVSDGLSVEPHHRNAVLLSQVRRADPKKGDPADSKTIEGDDCGNVKTIVGKWAKSKKVGGLAGSAKAAVLNADTAAKNLDDAIKQAKALGKKVGLEGKMPEPVKLAAESAEKTSKAATKASTELTTKLDKFKPKMASFAKEISNDDMVELKKATTEAITAAEDAAEAAERVLGKAEEARKKSLKSSDGALKAIGVAVEEAGKLSTVAGKAAQKSKHAAEDTADLVKKAKDAAKKIDDKIKDKDTGDQKPVWEAFKDDLKGREEAADESAKDVKKAIKDLEDAQKDLDDKAKTIKEVKDNAQSDPKEALGQTKNIDAAEESTRKLEAALDKLKGKVGSMMKDATRLEAKLEETAKKLK